MTTVEVLALIDSIARLSRETMLVLTGGEPLLRPDLDRLAHHAADLGLMVVIGTNGTMLDAGRVDRLIQAGVSGVGISLDSLDPVRHDAFRGVAGAWSRTMRGIDACRKAGLCFQIHFSVTNDNAAEFDDMVTFARESGALTLNLFFLVCTGRGQSFGSISRQTYDMVLRQTVQAAKSERGVRVRAKCAPHFKRLAMELDPHWPITMAHGYEAGGCLAGTRYCRITPEGEVTACPYIEVSVGSIRQRDFAGIWEHAPAFHDLRDPVLGGRCGLCEYRKLCGGCRARPVSSGGGLMDEDPLCGYQPPGRAVVEPLADTPSLMRWNGKAELRFQHVPFFVRGLVRRRVEEAVRRAGRDEVTLEDLHAAATDSVGRPPFVRPESDRRTP